MFHLAVMEYLCGEIRPTSIPNRGIHTDDPRTSREKRVSWEWCLLGDLTSAHADGHTGLSARTDPNVMVRHRDCLHFKEISGRRVYQVVMVDKCFDSVRP